jgi:hypothetical protein
LVATQNLKQIALVPHHPKAGQFLNIIEEQKYVKKDNTRSIPTTAITFFINSTIAPKPTLLPFKTPEQTGSLIFNCSNS